MGKQHVHTNCKRKDDLYQSHGKKRIPSISSSANIQGKSRRILTRSQQTKPTIPKSFSTELKIALNFPMLLLLRIPEMLLVPLPERCILWLHRKSLDHLSYPSRLRFGYQ